MYVCARTRAHTRIDGGQGDKDTKGPQLTNLTALIHLCPNVPWKRIFEEMASQCEEYGWECNKKLLADEKLIVMGAPYFYTKLNAALGGNVTIEFWKPLLRSHYIYNLAPLLNIEFLEVCVRVCVVLQCLSVCNTL